MYIDIILPVAITAPTFTYWCDYDVKVGCRVVVPFGRSENGISVGLVFKIDTKVDDRLKPKIKSVVEVLDRIPMVPLITLDFWVWMSQYYMVPLGEVVRTQMAPIFSKAFSFRSALRRMSWRIKPSLNLPEPLPFDLPNDASAMLIVERSELCVESLVEEIMSKRHMADDGMLLILAPDFHKSKALAQHLSKWWSVEPYNSTMTIQRRGELYTALATGVTPRIVVGMRTALSLPVTKWDAIIVLDAHHNAYKSEHQPMFGGRDAALYLSALHKASCYMVTPTPSVEMYYNAINNGWDVVQTPPKVEGELKSIVLERGKELISKYLRSKITDALSEGRKAVIFQNRRGYSSWVECSACGDIPQCPHCSASMTYHRSSSSLKCHHCNYCVPFDWNCKECGSKMEPYGRGTERLQEQIKSLFPDANVVRVDSDAVDVKQFDVDSTWDIMVGTQMVLDKRIDFSDVAVVGIANADNIASSADFRSNENKFQLIRAIGERCVSVGAELVVQSLKIDDAVVKQALSGDFVSFYNNEITDRQTNLYPPFARLIVIEFRSKSELILLDAGGEMEAVLRPIFGERLSPLFQPLIYRRSGEYIVRLLLRIERSRSAAKAKAILMESIAPVAGKYRNSVSVTYNVDPIF